ncbi:cytochrome P450 monooxygenase [Fomitopsis betulina]|nr:cytochrome P450 monooxygenase [Fomitopsis betulina]
MTLIHNATKFAGQYAAVVVLLYILYCLRVRSSGVKDLPPGPKRVPFFGNALQLPQKDQHITMTQWSHRYGDVMYAEFFGNPALILSSAKAAIELVEKRSAKYSGRPSFFYFTNIVGWTGNTAFKPYNERWKRVRRWYQKAFVVRSAARSYHSIQHREARKLLCDFAQDPGVCYHSYIVAIVFEVGYGRTVSSHEDDEFMRPVEDGVRKCLVGSSTGSALCDFLPILSHIPGWVPGMQFKRTGKDSRKAIRDMEDIPYDFVTRAVESGSAKPSFMTSMMEECKRFGWFSEEDVSDIKGTAGTLYAGKSFFDLQKRTNLLAMVQHPESFEKAQKEMVDVVGDGRLPSFDDQASLPYLACIIREVYRWCPPVATLPHQTTEDDVYRGYYIPKGTTVMPNIWAMFRDADVYPDPEAFIPERFLELNEASDRELRDPKKIVFGFGRRICPGRYFADDIVWLAAANIVATMNIRKARNGSGEEITPTPKIISGTALRPEPFLCDIRPRSEQAIQLICKPGITDAESTQ